MYLLLKGCARAFNVDDNDDGSDANADYLFHVCVMGCGVGSGRFGNLQWVFSLDAMYRNMFISLYYTYEENRTRTLCVRCAVKLCRAIINYYYIIRN